MNRLYVDIETRANLDLRASNVYRYVEDPHFEIMMAAYALNDEPVRLAIGEESILQAVGPLLQDPRVVKIAHNANFERVCFTHLLRSQYLDVCRCATKGWTRDSYGTWVCGQCALPSRATARSYLPPDAQWDDTMGRAGAWGRPQSLKDLAVALGAAEKDEAGTRLINLFCKPNTRTGEFLTAADKPGEWADFTAYCIQDVETLREVDVALSGWPTPEERRMWEVDALINDRGFLIDRPMAECAVVAAEENAKAHVEELRQLIHVPNPNSRDQFLMGMDVLGLTLPDAKAETITGALQTAPEGPVRRALELRQELALSASKKYTAALDNVCSDDRVRGAFRYFGAHTGRWSGRGFQPQNLPRAQLATETDTEVAILDLKMGAGADAQTLKSLLRALWVGPFTVVDYSAIEARVIAWLAGEEWALKAFRAKRDIYVETADRMGGLTRSQGKVAVLALGYQGSVGSLRAMGYGAGLTDQEILPLVVAWRAANPSIVALWGQLEHAFQHGGPVGEGHVVVEKDGTSRLLRLPSGRAVCYHDVRFKRVRDGNGGRTKTEITFDAGRFRGSTYGGRLAENITQAVARDVLAHGLIQLTDAGHIPVAHVHDEVVVEGGSVEEINAVFTSPAPWAPGLPVDGAGFVCQRYRKD